jgi:HSP20 family protein
MDKPKQLPSFFFASTKQAENIAWRPPVDVYRLENGWLLKFDLAGVRMEDVAVQVQGCRISVAGVRRDWVAEQSATHYSMEIAYNRFERTIDLPCQFARPSVTLEGRDGLLLIRVTEA